MAIALVGAGSLGIVDSGNVTPALPSGVQADDVLLACVFSRDNVALSFPGGWTISYEADNGTLQRITIAWKRAGSSESDPTITHTGGSTTLARVVAFRGCSTSGSPVLSASSSLGNISSPTASCTGMTPQYVGNAVFMLVGHNTGTVSSYTNAGAPPTVPVTWAELFDDAYSGGTRNVAISGAWGELSGSAATGNLQASLSASSLNMATAVQLGCASEAVIKGRATGSAAPAQVAEARAWIVARAKSHAATAGAAATAGKCAGAARHAAIAQGGAAAHASQRARSTSRAQAGATGAAVTTLRARSTSRAQAGAAGPIAASVRGDTSVMAIGAGAASPSPAVLRSVGRLRASGRATVTGTSVSRSTTRVVASPASIALTAAWSRAGSRFSLLEQTSIFSMAVMRGGARVVAATSALGETAAVVVSAAGSMSVPWLATPGIRMRVDWSPIREIDDRGIDRVFERSDHATVGSDDYDDEGEGGDTKFAVTPFVIYARSFARAAGAAVGALAAVLRSRSSNSILPPPPVAEMVAVLRSRGTARAQGAAIAEASMRARGLASLRAMGSVDGSPAGAIHVAAGSDVHAAPVAAVEARSTSRSRSKFVFGAAPPAIVLRGSSKMRGAPRQLASLQAVDASCSSGVAQGMAEGTVDAFAQVAAFGGFVSAPLEGALEISAVIANHSRSVAQPRSQGSIAAWIASHSLAWWTGAALAAATRSTLRGFGTVEMGAAPSQAGTATIQLSGTRSICHNKATVAAYISCPDYVPVVICEYRVNGGAWVVGSIRCRPAHLRRAYYYFELAGLPAVANVDWRVKVADWSTGTKVNSSDTTQAPMSFTTRAANDLEQVGTRDVLSGVSMDVYAVAGDPLSGLVDENNERQAISLARRRGGTAPCDVVVYGTHNPSGKVPGYTERYDQNGLIVTTKNVVAQPTKSISSVNTTTDRLNSSNHGLVAGQAFTISSTTGNLPAPLVAGTTYYVLAPTSNAFQVSATPGGAAIDLTTVGGGSISVRMPDLISASAHGFINGQPLTVGSTGTLPAPLVVGTTYWVVQASSNSFKLAATQGGAAITYSSAGTGQVFVVADGIVYAAYWMVNALRNLAVYGSVIGLEGFDGTAVSYHSDLQNVFDAIGYTPLYDDGGLGVTGGAWGCTIGGSNTVPDNLDAYWDVAGQKRVICGVSIVGVDMRSSNPHPDKLAQLSTADAPAFAAGEPVFSFSFGSALGGCAGLLLKNLKLPATPGHCVRMVAGSAKSNLIDTTPCQYTGLVSYYDCEFRAFRENLTDVSVHTANADYDNEAGYGTKTHMRMVGDTRMDIRRCFASWAREHWIYSNYLGSALSGIAPCWFLDMYDRPGVLGSVNPAIGQPRPAFQVTGRCNPDSHKPSTQGSSFGIYHVLFVDANAQCDFADGGPGEGLLVLRRIDLDGQNTGAGGGGTGSGAFGFYNHAGPIICEQVNAGMGGGIAFRVDAIKGAWMVLPADGTPEGAFPYVYPSIEFIDCSVSGAVHWDEAFQFDSVFELRIPSFDATAQPNRTVFTMANSGGSGKNGNGNPALGPTDDGPFLSECGRMLLGFDATYAGWPSGNVNKWIYRFGYPDEKLYTTANLAACKNTWIKRGNFANPL